VKIASKKLLFILLFEIVIFSKKVMEVNEGLINTLKITNSTDEQKLKLEGIL
jgi:hypothetical protein